LRTTLQESWIAADRLIKFEKKVLVTPYEIKVDHDGIFFKVNGAINFDQGRSI